MLLTIVCGYYLIMVSVLFTLKDKKTGFARNGWGLALAKGLSKKY